MEIYGFSGKQGVGKGYVADKFLELLPSKPTVFINFADQLKIETCIKKELTFERTFVKKDDESRRIMQLCGTEYGRDKFGEDIWIKYIDLWITLHQSRGITRFIITDVRFPNEVEYIRNKGGKVFRILAPIRNKLAIKKETEGDIEKMYQISHHISETCLDTYRKFDAYIDNDINGYVDDDMKNEYLKEQLLAILKV